MSDFDPKADFPAKEVEQKKDKGDGCSPDCGECADCGDCGDCNPFLTAGVASLLWATARGFRAAPAGARGGSVAQRSAVRAVRSYQLNVAARRARPVCRHLPSCSAYAIESVQRHGVRRGALLSWHRLRRCRPGGGGFDPVP